MKNKNGHFEIPSFLILLFIFMLAPKGIAGEIEAPQKIIQNISVSSIFLNHKIYLV